MFHCFCPGINLEGKTKVKLASDSNFNGLWYFDAYGIVSTCGISKYENKLSSGLVF